MVTTSKKRIGRRVFWGCVITVFGFILILSLVVSVLSSIASRDRSQRIMSGEWTWLDLYICSSHVSPGTFDSWLQVEEWVKHAHISLTQRGSCVLVTAVVKTSALRNGRFRKLIIRWTIKENGIDDSVQQAEAHVFVDTVLDENSDAALPLQSTWTIPTNKNTSLLGHTFEISVPASKIYSQLCYRRIIHHCH